MAKIGDPLYIKSKDTKVLKQPNATSESLITLKSDRSRDLARGSSGKKRISQDPGGRSDRLCPETKSVDKPETGRYG